MTKQEAIKALAFGTELEYTGITRQKAAEAIRKVVGGCASYTGGTYREWTVTDPMGREWRLMSDASLGLDGGCEFVTPVLKWEDMETLQRCVRALRKAGADDDHDQPWQIERRYYWPLCMKGSDY